MTRIVVPVRYPLTDRSRRTLQEAIELAESRDADLTILHVSLFQNGRTVTRRDLREVVREQFGRLPNARFVVRQGFLVEETILEEVVNEDADVVVVGHHHVGRFRRALRRLVGRPDVERFLREKLDCKVVTVS